MENLSFRLEAGAWIHPLDCMAFFLYNFCNHSYMNLFIKFCTAILLCSTFFISSANTHVLFDSGKTSYEIVVPKDASASEQYAATELQYWLKEISGITFPIVNNGRSKHRKRIMVGYYPEVMSSFHIPRPDDSDQGFVYGNNGDDIYIVGGRDIGTLYGVYSFLENELACRWYSKDVSVAPKRKKWSFSELYDRESPAFTYRSVYYLDAFDVDWSLRNKNNGKRFEKETAFGMIPTTNRAIWGVHTFNTLVPAGKYFKSHPEYFGMLDGKRTKGQLCLSNPDVLNLCKENLRSIIRKNPSYSVYSVTQNDNAKPCQCKGCKHLVEKYGGEAGIMIWFVNQIAASLESEFPDKVFATFAYSYSRHAPKGIAPRDNVLVRLCASGCCESHPLDDCAKSASFIKDLSSWSKLSSKIYLWDYVASFRQYLLPFPNICILQKNIQTYKKYNVRGVMNEGIYNTPGGDFYELRAYLLSKLLWNPDIDVDEVIDDFMRGYYEGSAPFMRMYFDKVQGLASGKVHLNHTTTDENGIFSTDFINSSLDLLNKAERAANSQSVRNRVLRQKMIIAYLQCHKDPERAIREGSYDLVMKMAKDIGMNRFAEYGSNKSIEDFESEMEKVKDAMKDKYSKEYLEYKLSRFLDNIKI